MHSQPRVVILVLLVCILLNCDITGEPIIQQHTIIQHPLSANTVQGVKKELILNPTQYRNVPNTLNAQINPMNFNNVQTVNDGYGLSNSGNMVNAVKPYASTNPTINSANNFQDIIQPGHNNIKPSIVKHPTDTQQIGVNIKPVLSDKFQTNNIINSASIPIAGGVLPSRTLYNSNTANTATLQNSIQNRPNLQAANDKYMIVNQEGVPVNNLNANTIYRHIPNNVLKNFNNPNVVGLRHSTKFQSNNLQPRKRQRHHRLESLEGMAPDQIPPQKVFRHPHRHRHHRRHHQSPSLRLRKRKLHRRVSHPYKCRGFKNVRWHDVDTLERASAEFKPREEEPRMYEKSDHRLGLIDENRRARALANAATVKQDLNRPDQVKSVLVQQGLYQPAPTQQPVTKAKSSLNVAENEKQMDIETARLAEHYLPYVPQILLPGWDQNTPNNYQNVDALNDNTSNKDVIESDKEPNETAVETGQEPSQIIARADICQSQALKQAAIGTSQEETKSVINFDQSAFDQGAEYRSKIPKGQSQVGVKNIEENGQYLKNSELDRNQVLGPLDTSEVVSKSNTPRKEIDRRSAPLCSQNIKETNNLDAGIGKKLYERQVEKMHFVKRSREAAERLALQSSLLLKNSMQLANKRKTEEENEKNLQQSQICIAPAEKLLGNSLQSKLNRQMLRKRENDNIVQQHFIPKEQLTNHFLNTQSRNVINQASIVSNIQQILPKSVENLLQPIQIHQPPKKRSNSAQPNLQNTRQIYVPPINQQDTNSNYINDGEGFRKGVGAYYNGSPERNDYYFQPQRRVLREETPQRFHKKLTRAQKKARVRALAEVLYEDRDGRPSNKRTAASLPFSPVVVSKPLTETNDPNEPTTKSSCCRPGKVEDEEGYCVERPKVKKTKEERIQAMLAKAKCRKEELEAETYDRNISRHEPYEIAPAMGTEFDDESPVATTTKKPVNETAVYLNIIHDLDEIKEGRDQPDLNGREGFPCHLDGVWISETAGVRFTIDSKPSPINVKVAERKFPRVDKLLSTEWDVTGSAPYKHDGLFQLLAIHKTEKQMAMFAGQCMRCYGDDMIVGKWVFGRESQNCRDAHLSGFQRKDVFRRPKKCSPKPKL